MEELLARLMIADTGVIKNATAELNEALKCPESIVELCKIAGNQDSTVDVRLYAAVLLREHLGKLENWRIVPRHQQKRLKKWIMTALLREKDKSIFKALALFVGCLLRNEPDLNDSWTNNVLQVTFTYSASSAFKQNEIGSYLFVLLTDAAPDQFVPHLNLISEIINHTFTTAVDDNTLTSELVTNIITVMSNLLPFVLGDNVAELTYQNSIPVVISLLEAMVLENNPEKFINIFGLLDNMAESTPSLLTNQIQCLLQFCLKTSSNRQCDNLIRVETIGFIGLLVQFNQKVIEEKNLLDQIIKAIFNIIAESEEQDDEDVSSPITAATQTMEMLAQHIPEEIFLPQILDLLDAALNGSEILQRKAAYLCLAEITDGCAMTICSRYLEPMVNSIKFGILDQNPIVRSAAFCALEVFSEYLQPDICKYASVILPILFEFLANLCAKQGDSGSDSKNMSRMFYALKAFCENLGDYLVPYLPILMERLFEANTSEYSPNLPHFVLSTLASVINAVRLNILPYLPRLTEQLQDYVTLADETHTVELRSQAIDTIAVLAQTIGKENFMAAAGNIIIFILDLLEKTDEPDLRRAVFNLLSSIAFILKEDMIMIYPKLIDRMLNSIGSINDTKFANNGDIFGLSYNRINDTECEDKEHEEPDGYIIKDAFLEEKIEAIRSLKIFAIHTRTAFFSYIKIAFPPIFKMVEHPYADVRKVSIDALVAFTLALFYQNDLNGVSEVIRILINKLCSIIYNDINYKVVIASMEGLNELLSNLKELALPTEAYKEKIIKRIIDVFLGETTCQFDELIKINYEEWEKYEYEDILTHRAASLLPSLGNALSPEQFAIVFGRVYGIVMNKVDDKKEKTDIQRCIALGTLSDSIEYLQNHLCSFYADLLYYFLCGMSDASPLVRQSATFGLGMLVQYAQPYSLSSLQSILKALSDIINTENNPLVLDNICVTIARLIINNMNLVPLGEILPVFLNKLPLKEDFVENKTIFKCFRLVYERDPILYSKYVKEIIFICYHVLCYQQSRDSDTLDIIVFLIIETRTHFLEGYKSAISCLPNAFKEFMQSLKM